MSAADELVERAVQRVGLDDLGPETYSEGLERWHDAAQRPPQGFGSAEALSELRDKAVNVLSNRLRIVDYAKTHPDVAEQEIERPLFVFGLPRTGTTLVSYLLDQDARRRSLLLWEASDTVPPATSETLRTDPRARALLEQQQQALQRDPSLARIHWESADGPTQCTEVHAHEFKSTTWDRAYPVLDYSTWLEDADLTSAYAFEKLVLQVLQSKAPGAWSLKMPAHAMFIESLLAVFPDARLVWTHRDPYRATASVLSPKAKGWERRWGTQALPFLLEYYPRQLGKHVQRPLRVRERIGHDRIYDLHYAELMRDPIGELRKLYAWAGDELTADTEARMQAWLTENPQAKHGKHAYTLDELGIGKAMLEPYFEEYLATYDIEPEPF